MPRLIRGRFRVVTSMIGVAGPERSFLFLASHPPTATDKGRGCPAFGSGPEDGVDAIDGPQIGGSWPVETPMLTPHRHRLVRLLEDCEDPLLSFWSWAGTITRVCLHD